MDGRTMQESAIKKYLDEHRERYQPLFDSNMIGIALSDFDDTIFEANRAFLDIVGYTKRDLASGRLTWATISPDGYARLDTRKMRELAAYGTIEPFEKEYTHKKGHAVPVLVGATTLRKKPLLGICFALDITRQKHAERKKDEFIGTVSHELRTPLAVLKMQVSLLRDELAENASRDRIRRSIQDIDRQIDRLGLLVSDMLNLARIAENGGERRALFDACRCAERVVADMALVSRRKVSLRKERGECFVRGNEMRIGQVITNLLTNALRYSPNHTEVVVRVKKRDGSVHIGVEDKGRGIPKDEQKKIFHRYYRSKHAGEHPAGSSGIGLHVCSEIVKQHRGRIDVKSAVGKGSTFTCVLPLVRR
jgi:PAS domain S-box-containing protein